MAAAAKAVAAKPFVGASAPRNAFTPETFLAPLAAAAAASSGGGSGGDAQQGGGKAASSGIGNKPWRAGGPPKKVWRQPQVSLCEGAPARAPPTASDPADCRRRAPPSLRSARSGSTSCRALCGRPRCVVEGGSTTGGASGLLCCLHAHTPRPLPLLAATTPSAWHAHPPFPPTPRPRPPQFAKGGGGGTKAFKPVGSCHQRLSMRSVNPYETEARPAPDVDFTLFATR